jgi:multidrug efflux pump subunit AcrA (membrane-fusion protein)
VSTGPEPQVDVNLLEQTRRQINRLVEEIAKLSEEDRSPPDFYGQFLQRVLAAVAAPAGAVWIRTPQGHLQLQFQIKIQQVGLDASETARQSHNELLRMCAQLGRQQLIPPHSGTGTSEEGKTAPGNPTDYVILIAPIMVDKQVAGLVEVWQDADRNPNAQRGFLEFIGRMAELASSYTRNHQLRHMVGQQTLWTQLEAFARQIHGSLNPMEVGYVVANEGRRLIDCDRVSVAIRRSKKTRIEAISGADVVEKRSNLVRLMARLMDKVLIWGEKLVYQGEKDDSLPPAVLKSLDAYLAESNSKLLVILPLKDERESESKKPPRSGLMMESFDPPSSPEQLIARLEVIGRHATSALYNASEYRRIPMRIIWGPLAKVQEGLGGKTRAIIYSVVAGVAALALALTFVPWPLKMDAKGQLLPKERNYIFSPVEAKVVEFKVKPGQDVLADDPLVSMHDVNLERQMVQILGEMNAARNDAKSLEAELQRVREEDRLKTTAEKQAKEHTALLKEQQLEAIRSRRGVKGDPKHAGYFDLTSPLNGTVLNSNFLEEFTNRTVKPNEPILRLGNKEGPWVIELKIPQKHIGQVLQAFDSADPAKELEVDLVLRSTPTRTYKGKLARKDIGGEAQPNRDENNEAEPVIIAVVRIEGDDIPEDYRVPNNENFRVTGTEVLAKIRCGNHALGYSLFYGVWEFAYEKIVFFF